jgi:hypothetical protein
MAGLALRGRTEQRGDIDLPFDVGLVGEVEVAAVRLRFTRKRIAQVLLGLRSFESHVESPACGGASSEAPTMTGAIALDDGPAILRLNPANCRSLCGGATSPPSSLC